MQHLNLYPTLKEQLEQNLNQSAKESVLISSLG